MAKLEVRSGSVPPRSRPDLGLARNTERIVPSGRTLVLIALFIFLVFQLSTIPKSSMELSVLTMAGDEPVQQDHEQKLQPSKEREPPGPAEVQSRVRRWNESSSSFSVDETTLKETLSKKDAASIWRALVRHGESLLKKDLRHGDAKNSQPIRVMEVGMHRANQCVYAATHGLEAHCVEPSPTSFESIRNEVSKQDVTVRDKIHLYQKVAGSTSREHVSFQAAGGTGDHVTSSSSGGVDVWNMKIGAPPDPALVHKQGKTVSVETMRLDDLVMPSPRQQPLDPESSTPRRFHAIKIDTQGYEPAVFRGLDRSLSNHWVDYILFEFWPKGMDLIVNATSSSSSSFKKCRAATNILESLAGRQYQLYPLSIQAHPRAPRGGVPRKREVDPRPFVVDTGKRRNVLLDHCLWYYQREDEIPSNQTYHMGYWSDILAVSPHATWIPST